MPAPLHLLLLGALALPAPADSLRALADSTAVAPPAVDYLWVVRTALLRAEEIDRIVERAREMGARGLLVQVVGRGDAYYPSELLPRSEALAGALRSDPGFDPLALLVDRAHAANLEVHAWMNCLLVWSAPGPPRDPRHVLNEHPEWVASLEGGRRMSRLSTARRRRLGVEGVFLTAAHPGVRTWVARIAQEIARRYQVDGIHLDYIRQPRVPVGYDPQTRATFAARTGVDPERLDARPRAERAALDSIWRAFQQEQITAVVREVRDSLATLRPGITLSAAVIADTVSARTVNAQVWMDWLREGLLDRAFPMCYAPPVQSVLDQMVACAAGFGLSGRVVPGIAVYNTSPTLAAAKILGARALGFPCLALYSYDALEERPGYWASLRAHLIPAGPTGGRP